ATVIASSAGTTGLIGSSMPSRACGARFCLRNLCEVDYAGMTMTVITANGERQVSIFLGTLPFSTYTIPFMN
ncbi:MAG: hypothetical protein WAL20_00155, partial [Rhodomicrobium sp.]